MDQQGAETNSEDLKRLLQSAKEGSHRGSRNQSQKDHQDEQHELKQISRIVGSLPVLGILSEIGFKEGNAQAEFLEEEQETLITKQLDDMNDYLNLQDSILVDIYPNNLSAEFLAKCLMSALNMSGCDERKQLSTVNGVIKVARNLMLHKKINKGILSKHILSNVHKIPLSVIIELTKSKFITAQQWVSEQYQRNILSNLKCQIVDYVKEVTNDDKIKILELILCIAGINDCTEFGSELKHHVNYVICSIFEQLDFSKLFCKKPHSSDSLLIMKLSEVSDSYNKERIRLATMLLQHLIVTGEKRSLDEAYGQHFNWLYQKLEPVTIDLLQELLLYLTNDTIMKMIKAVMKNNNVSFQCLLIVLSVWLISSEDAHKVISKFLSSQLSDAFELQSQDLLKICLLIARHCSLETLSGFPSYFGWFSEHIKQLKGIFSNEKGRLTFYITCLTSLLPVEAKHFLKIQFSNLSKIQNFGKSLVQEYITAAKTRMAYLKDTALDSEKSASLITQVNEFALKDVEKALSQYAVTGNIPNNLLEVSVFRKSYFIEAFLPALLVPDLIKNDVNRKKFIDDLQKAGKIPSKVMQTYQQALEAHELEEVFSIQDLVETVTRKISELPNLLAERRSIIESKKNRAIVQSYMSSFSTHLSKLYQAFSTSCSESIDKVPFEEKLVGAILDSICCACAFESKHDTTEDGKWLKTFFKLMKEYDNLQMLLEKKILGLLRNELRMLESYHLHAFACIVSLCNAPCSNGNKGKSFLIQKAVECIIATGSNIWLHCSLNFLSNVLLFSSEMFSDVMIANDEMINVYNTVGDSVIISDRIMRYWVMLYNRAKSVLEILQRSQVNQNENLIQSITDAVTFADSVSNIKEYKVYIKINQTCLEDWLEFELRVPSYSDVLSSYHKQDYYHHVIELYQTSAKSNDWQYKSIATKIVHSLLNFEDSKETTECAERCNHYGSKQGRIDGTNDMLNLLQSLNHKMMCSIDKNDDNADGPSEWLLSALVLWVKNIKEQTSKNKASGSGIHGISNSQISTLCCIFRALPPFTLFSSSGTSKITFEYTNTVRDFINDIAHLMIKDSLILPCNFTECLLDAIVSYCELCWTLKHEFKPSKLHVIFMNFFANCPIFTISVICHSTKPHIRKKLEKGIPQDATIFKSKLRLQESLSNKKFIAGDQFPWRITGVCVFNIFEEEFTRNSDSFSSLTVLPYQTLQVVFDCIMIRLCEMMLITTKQTDRLKGITLFAIQFFKRLQDIVIDISEDILSGNHQLGLKDLRALLSSECTLRMYPVAFLKILLQMEPLCLKSFATLLRNKAVISKCFCCVDALVKDVMSTWPDGLLIEPFSLSFLNELELLARKLQIKY